MAGLLRVGFRLHDRRLDGDPEDLCAVARQHCLTQSSIKGDRRPWKQASSCLLPCEPAVSCRPPGSGVARPRRGIAPGEDLCDRNQSVAESMSLFDPPNSDLQAHEIRNRTKHEIRDRTNKQERLPAFQLQSAC